MIDKIPNVKLFIPYILPVLQTSLTISVYSTVTIAICCWLYIHPVAKSREQSTADILEQEKSEDIPGGGDQTLRQKQRFKCSSR